MTKTWFEGLIRECDHISMVTEKLIIGLNLDIEIEDCSICEKVMLWERIEYMNGSRVCAKCAIVTIPCHGCSSLIHTLEDDVNYHNNKPYCEDCYDDLVFCDDCGNILENYPREIIVDNRSLILCNRCLDDSYFFCRDCDKWYAKYNTESHEDGNDSLCEDCYQDNYMSCSSCGDLVNIDDSYYDEYSDSSYCSSCYRDLESRLMDDDPNFKIQKIGYLDESFAVGMELELECNNNRKDITRYIRDEYYPFFYCKSDGSLSDRNGLEIPCQPMTWEYYKAEGKDKLVSLLDYLQGKDCKAWKTNAGIHISLSKRGFTTSHTYKFLKFFYENPKYIFRISRRDEYKFKQYCDCLSLDRKGLADKFKEDWKSHGGNKYEAVNLNHSSHYEVRIFAGTLKTSSVLANIEFCRGVYMYTKQEKAKDVSVKRFEQYILGFDPGSYENFINLFKIGG